MSASRIRSQSRRCNVAVDTGDPALPVAGQGSLAGVRRSWRSKWRAAVLAGVHLLIAAHIAHYLVRGRTLSPVEPSESMYTLELGWVNAGAIFFAVAILATLVFGRFFCGWACHLVALQDLCGWIMKKLGIRPRPFRSRFLVWMPLAVALYMFVWPTVERMVTGGDFPGFQNHLTTTDFWATFPGPLFALLTFVTCGFAAVYFLGAKGFCTYGCPYGAFFGLADPIAPGRIRVTDACEQCGHCTATCTSNVRVHDEVRRYGMVVDPGCMKCMDCVSVCPKDALYFGYGRPALGARPTGEPARRTYDLALGEELVALVVFVVATLAYRGLYDGPPLLMSVALGAITAFLTIKSWQLTRRGTVRVQNLNLKLGGRLEPAGRAFVVLTVAWLALTGHSAFVQWHRARGDAWLERTEATRAEVLQGATPAAPYTPRHVQAVERAYDHYATVDRWGLRPVLDVEAGLAWLHLLRGEDAEAERRLRAAIELSPGSPALRRDLVALYLRERKLVEAVGALERLVASGGADAADHFRLAGLLVASDEPQRAIDAYRACLTLEPDSVEARFNLGGLLRRQGAAREAVVELQRVATQVPGDRDVQVELGLAYLESGDAAGARRHLLRAIEMDPDHPESRYYRQEVLPSIDAGDPSRHPG